MKKFISIFISAVLLLSVAGIGMFAYADIKQTPACGDFRYFVLPDGTARIVDYTGSDETVTIPSTVNGYAVTIIDRAAFHDCMTLKHVTIPEGVKEIGSFAFGWCENLESAVIPESVENLEAWSFYMCRPLKNIVVPKNVKKIDKYAFYGCNFEYISIFNPQCDISDKDSIYYKGGTIYGFKNSTAQEYAEKYGRTFVAFDDCPHIWNDGVITKPASCLETGIKTFTCNICRKTYTEVVPKTTHNYRFCNETSEENSEKYLCYDCTVCHERVKEPASTVVSQFDNFLCYNTADVPLGQGYMFDFNGDGIINMRDYQYILKYC